MADLDIELIKFYHHVIRDEIGYSSDKVNKKCLKKVIDAFSKDRILTRTSDVQFDSPATRAAYIYEYGPCNTSTVYNHFLQVLSKNSWLSERMIRKDSITICCLGGGPAMEIVAIVKALEKAIHECSPKRRNSLKLNAIIMDDNRSWAVTAGNVIHYLPQILQNNIMNFHLYFLETNVRNPLTDDVKEVIKKCDIVTMVKFLSADPVPNNENNTYRMIKEIVQCVQESGMLFFMDSFRCKQFDMLKKVIDPFENMIEIYGPIHYHAHRMSFMSMRECLRLYSKYYGWRYCCLESTNCVCAWYKKVFQNVEQPLQRLISVDHPENFCD